MAFLSSRRLQDAQPGVQFAKSPNLAREPALGASTRRRRKAGQGEARAPPCPRTHRRPHHSAPSPAGGSAGDRLLLPRCP
ncbi:hypothetical protein AV530_005243 [Patagioenas fasciata monilis]|uniref:Uncharacterized protein n=1 Tax=Patagioenas fasciata monilis TaxID=372326 RepID=A0A1V4JL03_PATFA|nr:hypothetical protein AV530_005243 [Patagioenas fasciata monilis]